MSRVAACMLLLSAAACGSDWTVFIPRNHPGHSDERSGQPDPHVCTPKLADVPARHCAAAGDTSPDLPPCNEWIKIQPEGAVCSDGSPYKFFANFSGLSDNLVVMFEPGGACFDYDSCTRSTLGAVNPHGIPDDHMDHYGSFNLLRRSPENPTSDWNMVFVSYCTGDVHGGDVEATYPDPNGGPALTYRHFGARNTATVIDYLKKEFQDVPQLLVTGCSAGGTASTQNYALIREAVSGVQCGYMLDDSGPVFTSAGPSQMIHNVARAAWNLDPLLSQLERTLHVPAGTLIDDFGQLNTALAAHYPRDRFALTAFQRDLNYSLYSYAVFDPQITLDEIQMNWMSDLRDIKGKYESQPNMGYFMPFFRDDNCSHCGTIPPLGHAPDVQLNQPWLGDEIAEDKESLRDFIDRLLDNDQAVPRNFENDPMSDFTAEQAAKCLPKR